MAYLQNVASLGPFYRYYFDRCSSDLDELIPQPHSRLRSTRYANRLHDFSVTIRGYYKDVYVNSFFPGTPRLWTSLPFIFCLIQIPHVTSHLAIPAMLCNNLLSHFVIIILIFVKLSLFVTLCKKSSQNCP